MRYGLMVLTLVLTSCAGYSVTKGGCGDGYDVYRPDPYLLRVPIKTKDGNISGFEFTVKWLPNYNHRYRVRSWTGFGASDIKFDFKEGWQFTGIHDKNNNTEVLKALTDLTKHVIPQNPFEIAQSGSPEDRWDLIDESNEPVLYKIEFNECGEICGLRRFRVMECANTPTTGVAPIPRTKVSGSGFDKKNGGKKPDPASK